MTDQTENSERKPPPGGTSRKKRRLPPALISAMFVLGVVGWMASGHIGAGEDRQQASMTAEKKAAPAAFRVAVESRTAKPITRHVEVQGHLKPNRSVTVRAETKGTVKEVAVRKGARLAAGDVIVRLDPGERLANLEQAKARVEKTARDLAAARKLIDKGFQTESNLKQLEATHEAAKAELEAIRIDIERLTIRAPFAGVLNARDVEQGAYVAVRDPVATIVDDDPVVAVAEVAQQNIGRIETGAEAEVGLITGETVAGRIRYISAQADDQTRTYTTEIEIPNPKHLNIAGSTARVRIPTERLRAHFMSARLLSLGEKGELGVKTVDDKGRVVFHRVEVVRASSDGIWISGLPETVRLIVRGQGFVRDGQRVRAVKPDTPSDRAARP